MTCAWDNAILIPSLHTGPATSAVGTKCQGLTGWPRLPAAVCLGCGDGPCSTLAYTVLTG